MARYESLKDYFTLNRKIDILNLANDYIQTNNCNSNNILKDITILALKCFELSSSIAMVSMDVSAEVYETVSNDVNNRYYYILLTGNVLSGFSDMTMSVVKEITAKELQEENVVSLFGLPDISKDDLEEKAEWLYSGLYARIPRDPEHKYWFDPVKVKEKYKAFHNMHMWPAELDNGILGQIRFKPSRADIYNIEDMSKCYYNEPIPANSILLNSEYYKDHNKRCDDIIVATHELVHWNLHKMYIYILQLLEEDFKLMSCSSEPIAFVDSMSLKEKAYWYAEWQANELAIRVAMPKHLVEKAIEEYNNDESVHNPTDIPFSGRYFQNMIYKLSWDFNVPEEVMKNRLRQLGYDYADGTFVNIDDCVYPPFTFPHGTLKENETFVIDRDNYERLVREDKLFSELIENRYYLYTGYVICINDVKYIRPVSDEKGLKFELSDYACKHADECCLKLARHKKQCAITYTDFDYLCKLDDGKYSDENGLTQEAVNDYESHRRMEEDKKEAKRILNKMDEANVVSFKDALRFHINRLGINPEDIFDEEYLKESTFSSYYKGTRNPSLENILIICNKLDLPYKLCIDLLKRARIMLNTDEKLDGLYDYLLTITNATLSDWDLYLEENGFQPLV